MLPILIGHQLHLPLPLLLGMVASLNFILSLDDVEEFAALDLLSGEVLLVVHAVYVCFFDLR